MYSLQAKHAEDELRLTSSQLSELKSINTAVSSNLSDTVSSNRKLKDELAECKELLEQVRGTCLLRGMTGADGAPRVV